MHKYLVRDDIVYTDTDSIILENPLTNIGNDIGDMKLEYKIKES